MPRDEPPSGFAGGKVAKVDRVEWIYIPDQNTAVQALVTGEVDMIEIPPTDFLPILAASPDITVKTIDRIGTQAIMRPNHLIPPFDHPAARQALLYLAGDQSAYLAAMIGNPDYEVPCWAVFVCGTPLESKAGHRRLGEGRSRGQSRQGQGAVRRGRLRRRAGGADGSDRRPSGPCPGPGHRAEPARGRRQRRRPGARLEHHGVAPAGQGPARRRAPAAGTCSTPGAAAWR